MVLTPEASSPAAFVVAGAQEVQTLNLEQLVDEFGEFMKGIDKILFNLDNVNLSRYPKEVE